MKRRRQQPLRFALGLVLILDLLTGRPATAATTVAAAPAGGSDDAFRFGFSRSMFAEVNENDARAALQVWGQTVARERGIPADPEPRLFSEVGEIRRALQERSVDAIGIPAAEYAQLIRTERLNPVFITRTSGTLREQYVVLVRAEPGITNLAQLHGRTLAVQQNPRASLAVAWLEVELARAGLGPARSFFARTSATSKPSKVLLPVFFRQTDACLITESSFRTMAELNPQIGVQLRVIARSPELVPTVLVFRADYAPPFLATLLTAVRELHLSPAGQQVLTVFQSESIRDEPASCMDSALEILARHAELAAEPGGPRLSPPSGRSETGGTR